MPGIADKIRLRASMLSILMMASLDSFAIMEMYVRFGELRKRLARNPNHDDHLLAGNDATIIVRHCTAKSRRRRACRQHSLRRVGRRNPRCGGLVSPAQTGVPCDGR